MKLKGSVRPPSRKSSTSGWPAVVRNAVRAVVPVRIALIARVVPWTKHRAAREQVGAERARGDLEHVEHAPHRVARARSGS